MENNLPLKKNILLYRLILLAGGNGLTTPAIYFFFTQAKGFSATEALSLVGFALLAIAISEVPTGVIADKISRKFSIIFGHLILIISWIGLVISPTYWMTLFFVFGRGIGGSFISGADEALLYDSLVELKQTSRFKSIYNFSHSFELVSFALTIFIGGFLAEINLFLPILIHLILISLSTVFSILLTEPIITNKGEKIGQIGYLTHIRSCLNKIFSKSGLQNGLIGSFVALALVLAVFKSTKNILSPILDSYGLSVSTIGLIISAVILIKAVGAYIAGKISKNGNEEIESVFALIMCVIGILAIVFIHIPFIQLLFFVIIVGLDNPILSNLKTLINQETNSAHRSTILSLLSLFARGLEMVFLTSMGWITDFQTVNIALIYTSVWLSITVAVLIISRKYRSYIFEHSG